jgi:DNA polymerase III subunit gamma/tau
MVGQGHVVPSFDQRFGATTLAPCLLVHQALAGRENHGFSYFGQIFELPRYQMDKAVSRPSLAVFAKLVRTSMQVDLSITPNWMQHPTGALMKFKACSEQAVYKPVQGRFKVFMIDEVHMLTNTAFNAMLKTLEEPPEYLKICVGHHRPTKSSCDSPVSVFAIQFAAHAPETVFEHLTQVLQQENLPAEPLALKLLARAARGSMRDALSLTDQAIAFGSGQLQEATVRLMLGSVDTSHVMGLIDALARGHGADVVSIVEKLRLNGLSAASALEDMSMVLQRMAVLQAVPQVAAESEDPDHQELLRLSNAMKADETQLLYSICLHGRAELGLAPDEYAALTMVLLRLLAFKPSATHNHQAAAPTAEKKTLITTPSSLANAVTAASVAPAPQIEPPLSKLKLCQFERPVNRRKGLRQGLWFCLKRGTFGLTLCAV